MLCVSSGFTPKLIFISSLFAVLIVVTAPKSLADSIVSGSQQLSMKSLQRLDSFKVSMSKLSTKLRGSSVPSRFPYIYFRLETGRYVVTGYKETRNNKGEIEKVVQYKRAETLFGAGRIWYLRDLQQLADVADRFARANSSLLQPKKASAKIPAPVSPQGEVPQVVVRPVVTPPQEKGIPDPIVETRTLPELAGPAPKLTGPAEEPGAASPEGVLKAAIDQPILAEAPTCQVDPEIQKTLSELAGTLASQEREIISRKKYFHGKLKYTMDLKSIHSAGFKSWKKPVFGSPEAVEAKIARIEDELGGDERLRQVYLNTKIFGLLTRQSKTSTPVAEVAPLLEAAGGDGWKVARHILEESKSALQAYDGLIDGYKEKKIYPRFPAAKNKDRAQAYHPGYLSEVLPLALVRSNNFARGKELFTAASAYLKALCENPSLAKGKVVNPEAPKASSESAIPPEFQAMIKTFDGSLEEVETVRPGSRRFYSDLQLSLDPKSDEDVTRPSSGNRIFPDGSLGSRDLESSPLN